MGDVGQDERAVHSLSEILDRVADAAQAPQVSIGNIVERFGRASFTPLLLIPALAVMSPLSGIPGLSSLCGITIALVSAQMIARRDHAWFPKWLVKREISGERIRGAINWIRPVARWIDRHTRPRFGLMMHRPLIFIPQLVCFLSGAIMPALELVPFTSSILGAGVFLLALAMLTRDGLLALIAILPYLGAGWVAFRVLGG